MLKSVKTINLSNIRSGGALQVAISFLLELKNEDISKFNFLVTKEIFKELKLLNFILDYFELTYIELYDL